METKSTLRKGGSRRGIQFQTKIFNSPQTNPMKLGFPVGHHPPTENLPASTPKNPMEERTYPSKHDPDGKNQPRVGAFVPVCRDLCCPLCCDCGRPSGPACWGEGLGCWFRDDSASPFFDFGEPSDFLPPMTIYTPYMTTACHIPSMGKT